MDSVRSFSGIASVVFFSLFIFACSEHQSKAPDFQEWRGNKIIEKMDSRGKKLPWTLMLDCRRRMEYATNVHYYYGVSVNPETLVLLPNGTGSETIYPDAQLSIERYSGTPDGVGGELKSLISLPVHLTLFESEGEEGFSAFSVTASKATLVRIETFYRRVSDLKRITKEDDEILRLIEQKSGKYASRKIYNTPYGMPGLSYNDELECR